MFLFAVEVFLICGVLPMSSQSARGEDSSKSLKERARAVLGVVKGPREEELGRGEVELGRSLFWDERISADGKTACASCHAVEDWGADRRRFSRDAKGKLTTRNSQTVFNATLQPMLRWIGDRKDAAHQAEKSLTGSMGFAKSEYVIPVLKEHGYEAKFRAAFPNLADPVGPAQYARAIAAYEATLRTPAPFDRYLSGDEGALDAQQLRGLELFLSKGCVTCHDGPLLGGNRLETFGVTGDYWTATKSEKHDGGLFAVTKKEEDKSRFRVSMLRNVAKTGPYFHDGSVGSLDGAVRVMTEIQLGVELNSDETDAIVAFLKSLSGEIPENYRDPMAISE